MSAQVLETISEQLNNLTLLVIDQNLKFSLIVNSLNGSLNNLNFVFYVFFFISFLLFISLTIYLFVIFICISY